MCIVMSHLMRFPIVTLPSERTLRDYTNVIKAKSGLQKEVEASITSEHKKYVALVFD